LRLLDEIARIRREAAAREANLCLPATKIFAAEPSPGALEPPTAKIDRFLVERSRLRAFPRQEIFRGSGAPLGVTR